jgi:hypothetical protein
MMFIVYSLLTLIIAGGLFGVGFYFGAAWEAGEEQVRRYRDPEHMNAWHEASKAHAKD